VPNRVRALFAVLLVLLFTGFLETLDAQRPANNNDYYRQLRGLEPGGETITVNNLELHRDAAVFKFNSGTFAFFTEVNGKVTGAVFKGEGHLHITPPTPQERHNLSIVYHTEEFDEDFDRVVLRFTDSTAAELRKAATGKGEGSGDFAKEADEQRSFLRKRTAGSNAGGGYPSYWHYINGNLDLRLLEDVLSPAPGGFFYAAIHGHKFSRLFFQVDPYGVAGLDPEEVSLQNWDITNNTMTYPLAFHLAAEIANGTASGNEHNSPYQIDSEDIDISIQKTGVLSSTATVVVRADQDGLAVVPLNLYPTLRASKVETEKGEALDFVQEPKELDWDFGVVLAHPLKKGETATLKVTYAGKDAIYFYGGGNYFPAARDNWYPSSSHGFGDYATYHMLFHFPKGLQLIATGTKVHESTDGGITTSEWKTETPLAVVGFNLGELVSKENKFPYPTGGSLVLDAYANKDLTDDFMHIVNSGSGGMGTLSTLPMLTNELSQATTASQLYTNYFGQLPFPQVSLTQQTACSSGASWPMLVYLPLCGFLDDTQRHTLLGGSTYYDIYWKVVTPNEIAHQWWGQTVGFRSYRDQWMSQGFANTSATLYLQTTRQMEPFNVYWQQQLKALTWKNDFGNRPIDIGPVTMGYRINNPRIGWNTYDTLINSKGSYILHMIRMMMWSPNDGDAKFKAMMQDFVASHRLQTATTEDFKAMVEKHMDGGMNLDGNAKMDWFFNEYVYGTELPAYHFDGDVTQKADGTSSLHFKLVQSGVSADFKMPVPIYIEFADGRLMRMGSVTIVGNTTQEQTVALPKMPPVKKVSINHLYDVLSTEN
jgi:hypothetical protein